MLLRKNRINKSKIREEFFMENASKALIIAGAILLAILIIGLGMVIYNQAAGIMGGVNLDKTEIASFNNEFLQFQGNGVRGSTVNSLLQTVLTNNVSVTDEAKKVDVYGYTSPETATKALLGKNDKNLPTDLASTGSVYKVVCVYNSSTGLINRINITKTSN